jgi:hypothetical protein
LRTNSLSNDFHNQADQSSKYKSISFKFYGAKNLNDHARSDDDS